MSPHLRDARVPTVRAGRAPARRSLGVHAGSGLRGADERRVGRPRGVLPGGALCVTKSHARPPATEVSVEITTHSTTRSTDVADATGIANGTGIALTEEITERINGALAGKKPVTVTYVGLDDRPHMSLRGSTHVHGPDQLAIWVRHASGGIVDAIARNPAVGLLYRDSDSRTTYVFSGRAAVVDDEAVRSAVFDASPEPERDHDPDRKGVAVVVDLDEVKGGTVGGTQVSMSR
jgi:hypothetical protein